MLSAEHRTIVKATVPLLESGGEALTTHFYRIMRDGHPEARPLFNQAHQASGAQQCALANGVLMYTRHIDELEKFGGPVAQIISEHLPSNILPEYTDRRQLPAQGDSRGTRRGDCHKAWGPWPPPLHEGRQETIEDARRAGVTKPLRALRPGYRSRLKPQRQSSAMPLIDTFKHDHEQIFKLLEASLALGVTSEEGRNKLKQVRVTVIAQFRPEDLKLYPEMQKHAKTPALGDAYAQKMRGIPTQTLRFFDLFQMGNAGIQFARQMGSMISHLPQRMTREEVRLHPEFQAHCE